MYLDKSRNDLKSSQSSYVPSKTRPNEKEVKVGNLDSHRISGSLSKLKVVFYANLQGDKHDTLEVISKMNEESSQSITESNPSSISSTSSIESRVSVHYDYIAKLNEKSMEIKKEKERERESKIII